MSVCVPTPTLALGRSAALGLALSSLLALVACGGGSSAGNTAAAPPPAAAVTVAGTVAGVPAAPLFNQLPLQVAAVTLNGAPAALSRVQPGVTLVGQATRDSQGLSMQSADLRTELRGVITTLDAVAATFKVLDTPVTVNALTRLEQELADGTETSLAFTDLAVGDFVSVYGTPQTGGGVLATRVEREQPGEHEPELRGAVASLDGTAKTFLLGTQLVDYSAATVTGALAEGVRVEVAGALSGTTFMAARVRVEDAMGHGEAGEMEVSGALSGLDATAKTFTLQSLKVDYSQAAVEGTLAEGAVVEVEGALSATDATILVATKVEVRFGHMGNGASDREARGAITALADPILTVNGQVYWTDAQTLILDHDAAIPFSQLALGDNVEVKALSSRTNAAGQPYATRVEKDHSGH